MAACQSHKPLCIYHFMWWWSGHKQIVLKTSQLTAQTAQCSGYRMLCTTTTTTTTTRLPIHFTNMGPTHQEKKKNNFFFTPMRKSASNRFTDTSTILSLQTQNPGSLYGERLVFFLHMRGIKHAHQFRDVFSHHAKWLLHPKVRLKKT